MTPQLLKKHTNSSESTLSQPHINGSYRFTALFVTVQSTVPEKSPPPNEIPSARSRFLFGSAPNSTHLLKIHTEISPLNMPNLIIKILELFPEKLVKCDKQKHWISQCLRRRQTFPGTAPLSRSTPKCNGFFWLMSHRSTKFSENLFKQVFPKGIPYSKINS